MKTIISISCLVAMSVFFTGCLKDTCTRTYTIYTPVYKTKAEVRANIKSNAPKPIHQPGKMVVLGNYIFLNEVDKGIHIINNQDPATPVNTHFIDIPGNVDLAVKGNILYADLYTDLVALDISDPAAIRVEKIIDDVFENRRYGNLLADTGKVIVEWQKRDTTITIECGTEWQGGGGIIWFSGGSFNNAAAAPATGVGGSMARFTIMNNHLYTVTESALNVFNITTAHQPEFKNKVHLGWGIETIFPFANHLFIGSTTGMFVFATTNPEMPVQLSHFTHARACDPVISDGNFAYVTLRTGTACTGTTNQLDIINIQNITSPYLVKTYPLSNPKGLAKAGSTLLICDGTGGLKVYDASDVQDLQLMQTITGIDTYDVIAWNNIAIVVAQDGLYQYSLANPSQLQLLSRLAIQ